MARTIDVRLNIDDELAAFLDAEVKRLRTSGRAGYLVQLLTAALLAQRGDMSLVGLFSPTGTAPAPHPTKDEPPANTSAVDSALDSMF